ncbi:periplasmic component, ABC-type hydroxamate-dependent iron transport system [Aurantimonas manganoxydans SI85-9A1]|uniref:Periplasmic component, ABC-type hydroxamate-dependent iron transport system n=1 Tax=Aurantimonas manganoxydans (strain ATCC BAA-1229 / DSM 21871 / SI85-9A1) TaxID=287752 RepID=Q1YKT0_AURMS|nr:ABC transporter substrate-binding protein [Aurantimonas manganoxydans]EAS50443.1 periplasmic component, ABC-type hydroxamate-dependent iron transport system [Aurantimonas manganoxydans SI85-9A1]
MVIDRRALLGGIAATAVTVRAARATVMPAPRLRIASLDYALTETLLTLGHPPIAQTAAGDWDEWVVEPALPAGVADLGSSLQVNFERLALLEPDLILTTDYVARQETALARIAPVERLTIYQEGTDPLQRARDVTHTLAERTGRQDAADAFMENIDATFAACARRLARLSLPPVYLVAFMDTRHARIFGRHGLYQSVLDRLGVTNAYEGETNYWGFATVGVETLATARDVRLFAFEPLPPTLMQTLGASPLWRQLPFVKAGQVTVLPPTLMFGALPSALRFAELLTEALAGPAGQAGDGAPA